MTQRSALMARRPLAAALFVALLAPGMAFAQTAKEKALEARVAELERQVQLLLSSQQQQQTQIATTQEQVTQVQAAQAAKPAVPEGPPDLVRDMPTMPRCGVIVMVTLAILPKPAGSIERLATCVEM